MKFKVGDQVRFRAIEEYGPDDGIGTVVSIVPRAARDWVYRVSVDGTTRAYAEDEIEACPTPLADWEQHLLEQTGAAASSDADRETRELALSYSTRIPFTLLADLQSATRWIEDYLRGEA